MKRWSAMLIAGEPSGDRLGADLVDALRQATARSWSAPVSDAQPLRASLEPHFFGAGGPEMARAGVRLAVDLTRHSVIGLVEVLRKLRGFRRLFTQLLEEALTQQPDAIIGIDFSAFNRRLARAVQRHVRSRSGVFRNWKPRLVQYVSPQVWASRPGRAKAMERDYDLLLSIFPFEKEWYARRAPRLRVEYVGHPVVDRHFQDFSGRVVPRHARTGVATPPLILLLPGSRSGEIQRHAGPLLACARIVAENREVRFRMVLPSQQLVAELEGLGLSDHEFLRVRHPCLELQVGGLPEALAQASLAIASTGTVTMECACFGVPTVAFYKTSWGTYRIARCLVRIPHLAMPNILAGETLFPEFIQVQASASNLARAALELLDDPERRSRLQARLQDVIRSLGPPGASRRAAEAILSLYANG